MKSVWTLLLFAILATLFSPLAPLAYSDEDDDAIAAEIQAYKDAKYIEDLKQAELSYDSLPEDTFDADMLSFTEFSINCYFVYVSAWMSGSPPEVMEALNVCMDEAFTHAGRFYAGANQKHWCLSSAEMMWSYGMFGDPLDAADYFFSVATDEYDHEAIGYANEWLVFAQTLIE